MRGRGFPGALIVKNLPANAGDIRDAGWIHGLQRSPGGENGNPFEYSRRENPTNKRARQVVHGHKELDTIEQLNTRTLSYEASENKEFLSSKSTDPLNSLHKH